MLARSTLVRKSSGSSMSTSAAIMPRKGSLRRRSDTPHDAIFGAMTVELDDDVAMQQLPAERELADGDRVGISLGFVERKIGERCLQP